MGMKPFEDPAALLPQAPPVSLKARLSAELHCIHWPMHKVSANSQHNKRPHLPILQAILKERGLVALTHLPQQLNMQALAPHSVSNCPNSCLFILFLLWHDVSSIFFTVAADLSSRLHVQLHRLFGQCLFCPLLVPLWTLHFASAKFSFAAHVGLCRGQSATLGASSKDQKFYGPVSEPTPQVDYARCGEWIRTC
eukprot:6462957-Amphidinium_carterae.1